MMSDGLFGALCLLAFSLAFWTLMYFAAVRKEPPHMRKVRLFSFLASLAVMPTVGWFLGPSIAGIFS
jgi:hypothetical protein